MRFKLSSAVIILFLIYFSAGCKKDSSPVSNIDTTSTQIKKSTKRGLAFNLVYQKDFEALYKGVSWWYNWGTTTEAPTDYNKNYQMEFIPMLWGGNTSASDISKAEQFILAHPEIKYLLVMNEPNLTNQANRTPQQAAADWKMYEQIISDLEAKGRTIYLVGPAITWGTMTDYSDPVKWLDAFYNAYKYANNGNPPKIDYLAFHWYDYGLSSQLDRLKKYEKKIWITEMANWNSQINSYAKQKAQMKEMVEICELRDDVFRYAWFIGRGTFPDTHYSYLLTAEIGKLSELGEYYLSLPY